MITWTIGNGEINGSADHGVYDIALHHTKIFSLRYTPNSTGIAKLVSSGTIPELIKEAELGVGSFRDDQD